MPLSSLHDKLLTLPDETRVFPAHGAGSACGRGDRQRGEAGRSGSPPNKHRGDR
jgi:glyoxylase-like metal-dependent hydrolase (beta-lactamase superfamily II)